MSFGYTDKTWIDPEPEEERKCAECDSWIPCPCRCGWGWCIEAEDFTDEDDGC